MNRSSKWKRVRVLAWERDRKARAPCHICGKPIDYFAKPSSTDDSWEPDHLIPFSKRPDLLLDLMNVAPSHKACNRLRGDGSATGMPLGLRSREW